MAILIEGGVYSPGKDRWTLQHGIHNGSKVAVNGHYCIEVCEVEYNIMDDYGGKRFNVFTGGVNNHLYR